MTPDNLIRLLNSTSSLHSVRRLTRGDRETRFSPKHSLSMTVTGSWGCCPLQCLAAREVVLISVGVVLAFLNHQHPQNSAWQWLSLQGACFHPPHSSKTSGSSLLLTREMMGVNSGCFHCSIPSVDMASWGRQHCPAQHV